MSTSINLPKAALWIVGTALLVGSSWLLFSDHPGASRNPGTITSPYHAHANQPAGLKSP